MTHDDNDPTGTRPGNGHRRSAGQPDRVRVAGTSAAVRRVGGGLVTSSGSVPTEQWWRVGAARVRQVLLVAFVVMVVGPDAVRLFQADVSVPAWLFWAVFLAWLTLSYLPWFAVETDPMPLAIPVRGRWLAMNSPATRVPSHLTLAYGQSHAIDLVAEPADGGRPSGAAGAGFVRPERFPGFGVPIHAPVDGVVVAVSRRHRDHRSRGGWALLYLLIEGMVREIGGPGFILGNHIIIERSGGGYVALAHLQQHSPTVAVGDRVAAGDVIGRCGNSGNSTEPHLHLQLMDHRRPVLAAGLPFCWRRDGEQRALPATGSHLEAVDVPA